MIPALSSQQTSSPIATASGAFLSLPPTLVKVQKRHSVLLEDALAILLDSHPSRSQKQLEVLHLFSVGSFRPHRKVKKAVTVHTRTLHNVFNARASAILGRYFKLVDSTFQPRTPFQQGRTRAYQPKKAHCLFLSACLRHWQSSDDGRKLPRKDRCITQIDTDKVDLPALSKKYYEQGDYAAALWVEEAIENDGLMVEEYEQKAEDGRLWATRFGIQNMKKAQRKDLLPGYLCIDVANAHPTVLDQQINIPDAPEFPLLRTLAMDPLRARQHHAKLFQQLDRTLSDQSAYKLAKTAIIATMYGSRKHMGHAGKEGVALQKELRGAARLLDPPKKDATSYWSQDLAMLLQREENAILTAMRGALADEGIDPTAFIFDALIIPPTPNADALLKKMEQRILNDTGYTITLTSKTL